VIPHIFVGDFLKRRISNQPTRNRRIAHNDWAIILLGVVVVTVGVSI